MRRRIPGFSEGELIAAAGLIDSAAKELYTIGEVAALLSLSRRTVESLIAHGHLRSAIAPGTDRARRISKAMIEEYVAHFNSQNPPLGGSMRGIRK